MTPQEKDKHEQIILKLINDIKLLRFDHIFGHYKAISRATAYNHDLDKLDSIKEALEANRSKGVSYLLQKWITGENATLQIAAMRLICTNEERQMLNQQYIEHQVNNVKGVVISIDGKDIDLEK